MSVEDEYEEPQPVQIVDKTDKTKKGSVRTKGTVNAQTVEVVDASGGQITTFGADPVGLKDTSGTPINPAKEDGNLATIAGDTTSIDGKIPSDPAKESGHLATIDGKITTKDLDTGAGTDNRQVVGILKEADGGATIVSPATEDGHLATIDGKIPSDPAKESGKLSTIDSTLTAIKDVAGIKKITDTVTVQATDLDIRDLGASDVPDLSDRAARLVGKVYGNQDVLQQRATTKELKVQIQHQGAEKDPTQIRALTSASDSVEAIQDTFADLKGTTKLVDVAESIINPAKEDGNLATIKTNTDKLDVNLSTRALETGGNLATIAGDTTSIDGKVTVKDLDTGAGVDNRQVVGILKEADGGATIVSPATEDGNLATIAGKDFATETTLALIKSTDGIKKITDPIDMTDDYTRQLGRVAGSQGLPFKQKVTTGEMQIDDGGNVISVDDGAGSLTVDAVDLDIRNLGASDVPDLSDRAARLVGKVYGDQDILQQRATTKELKVQIQHQGAEKDPTQIRALTATDKITVAGYSGLRSKKYEDTSFLTGDSPATLDVNTDLGRNGRDGYIVNDGDGNFTVEISNNGTDWGDAHTIKKNEVYDLEKEDIDSIRITWVADSAYRVKVI